MANGSSGSLDDDFASESRKVPPTFLPPTTIFARGKQFLSCPKAVNELKRCVLVYHAGLHIDVFELMILQYMKGEPCIFLWNSR